MQTPFAIVKIYIAANVQQELTLYSDDNIDQQVHQFAKKYHLKRKAIPLIKNEIKLKLKDKNIDNSNIKFEPQNTGSFTKSKVFLNDMNSQLEKQKQNNTNFIKKKDNEKRTNKINQLFHKKSYQIQDQTKIEKVGGNSNENKQKIIQQTDIKEKIKVQKNYPPKHTTVKSESKMRVVNKIGLADLQAQMQKQMKCLQEKKQCSEHRFQQPDSVQEYKIIKDLYAKLTKNNPVLTTRIHPDFINFTELNEDELSVLHELFSAITQTEIQNLTVTSFADCIHKYNLLKQLI